MHFRKYKFTVKDKFDKLCLMNIIEIQVDENLSESDETILVFEA
jgi:hypothetical protein